MKSNKQRRAEIVARRLVRADRLQAQMKTPRDARGLAAQPGCAPADLALLARLNNSHGLPSFYLDRPFTCRDCGAQAVWTAKQQKWWYEVVQAGIDSRAVRCLPCRRARRAALAAARAAPGANLLGDEVAWLRAVSAAPPDAPTEARVEAALRSKWDGVRKVAIEVLGRWRRPADLPRLREWVRDESLGRWSAVRRAAGESLVPLARHPQDDAWVLDALADAHLLAAHWAGFVQGMPATLLEEALRTALDAGEDRRLANLCIALAHARRLPSPALLGRLLAHRDRSVAAMARWARRTAAERPCAEDDDKKTTT